MPMMLRLQIAKFKFYQNQLRFPLLFTNIRTCKEVCMQRSVQTAGLLNGYSIELGKQ